jgi:hypothetical protein
MSYFSDKEVEEAAAKSEKLGYIDQAKIVLAGIKKGVHYDGCTAVPNFDFGFDCCGEHDAHYQLQDIPKSEADTKLRQCIIKKGYPMVAWFYYIGVSTVGWIFYKRKAKEFERETIGEQISDSATSDRSNVA